MLDNYIPAALTLAGAVAGLGILGAALLNNLVYVLISQILTRLVFDPLAKCVTLERCARLTPALVVGASVLWALLDIHPDEMDRINEAVGSARVQW